jgi:hypothetical protein
MALKNLSLEEMTAVSLSWVSPENPARKAIQGVPRLAGMLPDVERAHALIFAVTPKPEDPRRAELARRATEADAEHDQLAGAIYGILTEHARLDPNGAELLTLRDRLMPGGLGKVVNASYRGEAGFGRLVRERITPAVRTELEKIPLRQGNLYQQVEAWLACAERLGALEEERSRFDTSASPSLGRQSAEARSSWIRVVNAFESVSALAELDAHTERLVFGPLRDAAIKADLRSGRRKPEVSAPQVAEVEAD